MIIKRQIVGIAMLAILLGCMFGGLLVVLHGIAWWVPIVVIGLLAYITLGCYLLREKK